MFSTRNRADNDFFLFDSNFFAYHHAKNINQNVRIFSGNYEMKRLHL